MKDILLNTNEFRVNGRLWIEGRDDRFLGIGRLELLERIDASGSISKAAQEMGMSYKKAWDLVNSMNAQAQSPLVITHAGGRRGGGTLVTPLGKQAIQGFRALQERFELFMQQETFWLNQQ